MASIWVVVWKSDVGDGIPHACDSFDSWGMFQIRSKRSKNAMSSRSVIDEPSGFLPSAS